MLTFGVSNVKDYDSFFRFKRNGIHLEWKASCKDAFGDTKFGQA